MQTQFEVGQQVVVNNPQLFRHGRCGIVEHVAPQRRVNGGWVTLIVVRWNDGTMRSTYNASGLVTLTEWLNAGNTMDI